MITETNVVTVANVSKSFPSNDRRWGRSRGTTEVVHNISFQLESNSVVGFLGANGAGKTTVLKLLSGILTSTSGEIDVRGFVPSRRNREFLRQITLVMGQRHRLVWDLPVIESFELQRVVYGLDRAVARRQRDDLVDQLHLGDLLRQPARTLSLGQRMRCEIAVALAHRPVVVFLDEPTLGLDVAMQRSIRTFLSGYRQRTACTMLLTSHNMTDLTELCDRALLIEKGRLSYDGTLSSLTTLTAPFRKVVLLFTRLPERTTYAGFTGVSRGNGLELRVGVEDVAALVEAAASDHEVHDVSVVEPTLDDVLALLFTKENPS